MSTHANVDIAAAFLCQRLTTDVLSLVSQFMVVEVRGRRLMVARFSTEMADGCAWKMTLAPHRAVRPCVRCLMSHE